MDVMMISVFILVLFVSSGDCIENHVGSRSNRTSRSRCQHREKFYTRCSFPLQHSRRNLKAVFELPKFNPLLATYVVVFCIEIHHSKRQIAILPCIVFRESCVQTHVSDAALVFWRGWQLAEYRLERLVTATGKTYNQKQE